MDINVNTDAPGTAVVQPMGRIDLLSASEVRQTLVDLIAAGNRYIVIDLAEVPFIDSTGLASLISGLKAARLVGGDVRIARPKQQAKMLFELTRLSRVLPEYETVEAALSRYGTDRSS